MSRSAKLSSPLIAALVVLAAACSGGPSSPAPSPGAGGDDAGGRGEGGADPSPNALSIPLPRVPYNGGALIAHVKLVTITFQGYPYEADVQAFGEWIVGSSWLETVGREYGVGTGTQIAKLVLQYTPPAVMSTRDITTYLAAGITSGVFPQPDADTLYVIYYPATTRPDGFGCDGAWWGHDTVTSPVRFTWAAIPACPPPAVYGWTPLESIEQDASHEIIEALTDPAPRDAPGYAIDDRGDPFHYLGTEIADLCVGLNVEERGFTAQRVWSNRAAAAAQAPCVPAPEGDVFFAASPASSPLVVPAGKSANVTITAFATGARAPWKVGVLPYPGGGFDGTVAPTGTLDRSSLGPGDTATLTVSVPAGAKPGSRGILVLDSLTVGPDSTFTSGPYEWPVLVEVP